MVKYDLDELRQRLAHLPVGLAQHCERTMQVCRDLAIRHGEDVQRVQVAALLHDVARPLAAEELLRLARGYHLPITWVDESMPFLLHGPVGALLVRRDFGITDEGILEAVSCHTVGKPNMSHLARILFIGDKTEPGKEETYPGIARIRALAADNLDRAILEFFNWEIGYLIRRHGLIHPLSIEARNELVARLRETVI